MEGLAGEQLKNLGELIKADMIGGKDKNNPKGKNDEKEKMKKSRVPKNTDAQIFVKSIKISMRNWKYFLFDRTKSLVEDILELIIPIQKGLIIDCITDKSKHHLLFPSFIRIAKFIIIKLLFHVFFQLGNLFFFNESFYEYKDTLIEDLGTKDIEFFDSYNTGELIERVKNCNQVFEKNIIDKIIEDIQRIAKMLYYMYFLFKTNYKMALMSLFIIFIHKLGEHLSIKRSGSLDINKFLQLDEKYNNYLTDFILNIKLIKSFGKERYELDRLKKLKREIYNLFINIYMTIFEVVLSLSKIGDYFILYYTGSLVIAGKISFGAYSVFQTYLTNFQLQLEVIYRSSNKYRVYLADWRKFFELYDYKPRIKSLENYKPKEEEFKGKIEFQNVKFNYPLTPESNILEDLSFTIEPGKILALVGYSGSGKTTISNLIQRYYDPIEGNILLDDINIKNYDLSWLHNNIGFVSQEPSLCNDTIEYNITYGLRGSQNEKLDEKLKAKLNEVCEIALVNQFVNDKKLFPDGLNTIVGERGSKVSGGQKQRIAIARAIMKDIKILVLDEATSALDAENENAVQKALESLIKKKKITAIIIAHRLSTVKNADKIIFLNKGKIIESGTHEELLNKNGEYKQLMSKQII